MKFDTRAFALTAGLIWGGVVLLVSLANLCWPEYGTAFLSFVASVYPGYTPSSGTGSIVIGTAYGFVDGLVGGVVFAWLYNRLAR